MGSFSTGMNRCFGQPPLQSFLNLHRLPREFDYFASDCDLYVDRTFDEIKKHAVEFAISFTNFTACDYLKAGTINIVFNWFSSSTV